MLRVGPSKISLEARDLKWHQANIQRRLSKRAHEAGLYTKATVTNDPDLNLQAERSLTIPARAPLTPPTPPTEVGEEDDDEDIISKKPIPPESSKYWEQIVADAGVSGSVENISAEPSISLKHARQSRTASSATTLSNSLNDSDQENQVTGEKPHEGPSRSSGSLKSSHFHQVDAESLASKQIRKFAKRSLFPSFRHRKPWNFDGPYETMSRASAPIQDETGEDLHDDLYGDYHDRRTFSTSWQTFESEQSNRSARRQMSTTSVTGSHPSLPSLFSPGLLSQPPRRRRNMTYRPRSQSYSYVDSAEFQGVLPDQHDGLAASPADLEDRPLFDASQRHVSYSNGASQAGGEHDLMRPRSSLLQSSPHSNLRSRSSNQSLNYTVHQAVRITSHPSLRSLQSQTSLQSLVRVQTLPRLASNHSSPYNPFAANPLLLVSTGHPPLPIPPPFSSTPRSNSSNLSPAAEPFLPRYRIPSTPSSRSISSTYSPFTQTPLTQNPHTLHSSNNIAVYNDSLPALSQPQTPADLSSAPRGLAQRNPFNSAPVPQLRRVRSGWGTPSRTIGRGQGEVMEGPMGGERGGGEMRAARAGRNQEAENEGRVSFEERVWRRRRDEGIGMGVEERERARRGL